MKTIPSKCLRILPAILSFSLMAAGCSAADPETPISAKDLAARLSALQNGTSYTRLRFEVKQPGDVTKIALQLQIKERRTKAATELVYQVLWPKERKGEAVLLHKAGGRPATGSLLLPPGKARPLDASQMNEPLFGGDLSYQDIVEDFFAWENQALAGSEVVNHVSCVVLESKPGKSERSNYGSVRSWIDPHRLAPLRVEKYLPSGQFVRRIETTRVVTDDRGRSIPANLIVHGAREDSTTELDGSKIEHDVSYNDDEFTPEGLSNLAAPRASSN